MAGQSMEQVKERLKFRRISLRVSPKPLLTSVPPTSRRRTGAESTLLISKPPIQIGVKPSVILEQSRPTVKPIIGREVKVDVAISTPEGRGLTPLKLETRVLVGLKPLLVKAVRMDGAQKSIWGIGKQELVAIRVPPVAESAHPSIKPLSVNIPKIARVGLETGEKPSILRLGATVSPVRLCRCEVKPLPFTPAREGSAEMVEVHEDEQDIFEDIEDFYRKITLGLGSVIGASVDRPICIVLDKHGNDSFIYSLALMCREIYRIVEGGKPEPRWLSKGSKEEIEECMSASGRVFIIDDERCEILSFMRRINGFKDCKKLQEVIDKAKLFDRLSELFSQGFGFIIFHLPEYYADYFASILEEGVGYRIPKLVRIRPVGLHERVKAGLASMCWGFVDVRVGGREYFDKAFGDAEKSFYNSLEKILNDTKLRHFIREDSEAGWEHEALKAVVAEALAMELGAQDRERILDILKSGGIETEYGFGGGRADIYVKEQNRYVEVETFYGTGDPISGKLDKVTLTKYREKANRVDIVVLGLHMLLYLKRMLELKRIYKEHYDIDVRFFTVDIPKRRLVPMREVLEKLREFSLYPREDMEFEEAKKSFEYIHGREGAYEEVNPWYENICKHYGWKRKVLKPVREGELQQ